MALWVNVNLFRKIRIKLAETKYDILPLIKNVSVCGVFQKNNCRQLGGYNAGKAREIFDVPDDYEVLAALAIGKTGHDPDKPDIAPESEIVYRSGNDISSFTFEDKWGTSFSLPDL